MNQISNCYINKVIKTQCKSANRIETVGTGQEGGRESKPSKDCNPHYTCPLKLEQLGTFDYEISWLYMILYAS